MKFINTPEIKDIKPLKKKRKFKKTILGFQIFFILAVLVMCGYGVYAFLTTYGFQTPILLQSPIYPLKANVLISPVGSSSAKFESAVFDLGKIADRIYTLESSNGKQDGCRSLGLYNGFGYRQNSAEWVCYHSHQEVRSLVILWLENHIKNGDIEHALCLYNKGTDEHGCAYAMNYQTLK